MSAQVMVGPDIRLRIAIAVVLLAAAAHSLAHYPTTSDDAFISLRYAQNLVDGHGLVWNPGGERVASDPGLSQPMEWEDVRTTATQGAVFGGHGATHALLTGCSDAELATELETCRRRLTEQLGHEISLFAYPDTGHDARTVSAVRAAGFRYAFIGDGRVYTPGSDPLRIPRISIDGSLYSVAGRFSWTLLEAEILGAFDGLRRRFGWSP